MITSIHTLIYSDDAKATRAFLRDVLGWKYVAEDSVKEDGKRKNEEVAVAPMER